MCSRSLSSRLLHRSTQARHQAQASAADRIRPRLEALLEDLGGVSVRGYRAATYSINAKNLWALDILNECGYDYSSSIYPIAHDLYGMPEAPRFAYAPHPGFTEVPITTIKLLGKNRPCGGGGYFRLLPYRVSRWAITHVNRAEAQACVFYFHPWELDPEQPRPPGIGMKTRFRHYLNLRRMRPRLQQLLRDFAWGRMDDIFLRGGAGSDYAAAAVH